MNFSGKIIKPEVTTSSSLTNSSSSEGEEVKTKDKWQPKMYAIECSKMSRSDFVCISFLMPQTEKKVYSAFEKPGRMAAHCNLTYQSIQMALKTDYPVTIDVYSEEGYYQDLPPMG